MSDKIKSPDEVDKYHYGPKTYSSHGVNVSLADYKTLYDAYYRLVNEYEQYTDRHPTLDERRAAAEKKLYQEAVTSLREDLKKAESELARLHEFIDNDRTVEERDNREDQIERIYRALGGTGEWCAKVPPQPPPESGDLGEDSVALAENLMAELSRCAFHKAFEESDKDNELLRAEIDKQKQHIEALRAVTEDAVKSLSVLRTMLKTSGLFVGYERAEQMLKEAKDALAKIGVKP